MSTRWRGMLAPLGVSTGDGRRFKPDGVTHRELPLALKWQRSDEPGHDNSVVIGSFDTLNIATTKEAISQGWVSQEAADKAGLAADTLGVWGQGELFDGDEVDAQAMPRLAEDVAEARLLLDKQVVGPSVDPGAAEAVLAEEGSDEPISEDRLDELLEEAWETGIEPPIELLFTQYEIAAATLVPTPAFAQCRPFELLTDDNAPALTAAVRSTGWGDIPLADREMAWDGAGAAGRLADKCGLDGDSPDWGCYSAGFLYRDDEADAETRGAYGFGIVDLVDGENRIVPRGVYAVANVLSGGRGGSNLSDDEVDSMKSVVSGLYARMREEFEDDSIVPPWDGEGEASLTAARRRVMALTAAAPMPPAELFADPQLQAITPITLEEVEGGWTRVFGHMAQHGTCHAGFRDTCVTPPTPHRDFVDFHRYTTTADGMALPVPAGRLTTGHGQLIGSCACCRGNDDHACSRLSAGAAIAHHDRMTTLAYICAGVDEHGHWMAGILAPGLSDADRAVLGRRKVSGDWRDIGGNLELVEVLALAREKPGFPIPRTALVQGRQMSLTAAGTVRVRESSTPAPAPAGFDYDRMGQAVAEALVKVQGMAAPWLPAGHTVTVDTTPLTAAGTGAPSPAPPAGDVDQDRAATAAALLAEVDGISREAQHAALLAEVQEA